MNFPHLFSPLTLGNIELPNRIVHVPTDISSSHADGEVSEALTLVGAEAIPWHEKTLLSLKRLYGKVDVQMR